MKSAKDLFIDLDKYKNNTPLTHNFHPYPAKFIPKIPEKLIIEFSNAGDTVLDPFSGSGTTLVEANLLGRHSIGIDLNPIAYLIGKVKTTTLNADEIDRIHEVVKLIVTDINLDREYSIPNFTNIDLWFKDFVQRELAVIKHHIASSKGDRIKDFLQLAFSSIIVKVSNQDSDTRYAAIEKGIKPHEAAVLFESKVMDMIRRMNEFKKISSQATTTVYLADATNIDFIKQEIDLALTSPPYMNSFDYYLYHKHRMHWLGYDVKSVQEKEFGSRNKHNDNKEGMDTYFLSIKKNALDVKKILKKNGIYCVIVGDAILRGKLIKMNVNFDKIFIDDLGYSKVTEMTFDQRKYTRTFTPNLRKVYKDSYILVYQNLG